jgi:hypothetical protein
MRADIQDAIMRFYPAGLRENPLDNATLDWSWDRDNEQLRLTIVVLEAIDDELTPFDGDYVVGETVLLPARATRVRLSYLGPFAHVTSDDPEVEAWVRAQGYTMLTVEDCLEPVPWLRDVFVTVGEALFSMGFDSDLSRE